MRIQSNLLVGTLLLFTQISNAALVINEVDADQTGTDSAEFVELLGDPNMSLNGVHLALIKGSGETLYQSYDLTGQATDANGFFVICGNAANVVNCDLDVAPDTNLIQQGADAVAIYSAPIAVGASATTTNLIDAVAYDTNDADDSGLLTALGLSTQINEAGLGNSTIASVSRFGSSFQPTEIVTPGGVNAVPEPSSFLCVGLLGVSFVAWRRRSLNRNSF